MAFYKFPIFRLAYQSVWVNDIQQDENVRVPSAKEYKVQIKPKALHFLGHPVVEYAISVPGYAWTYWTFLHHRYAILPPPAL